MALPLPPGLIPSEIAFLCEMEMVTIVPRQRLEGMDLLSGTTPTLRPPHRASVPLWLALLLKRQRRANIVPPPWLHPASLQEIIYYETRRDPEAFSPPPPNPSAALNSRPGQARQLNSADTGQTLSPPFLPSCTASSPAGYLPYHWLELAETLLSQAADDMPAPAGEVRGLLRDLVEVRGAKMRGSTTALAGGGGVINLRGVGAMELAESRGFVLEVVDGVRKIGASVEASRREEEELAAGAGEESDEEMGI